MPAASTFTVARTRPTAPTAARGLIQFNETTMTELADGTAVSRMPEVRTIAEPPQIPDEILVTPLAITRGRWYGNETRAARRSAHASLPNGTSILNAPNNGPNH